MQRRKQITKLVKTLIVGLIAIAFILPLAWMVTSSLKQTREVFSPNWKWLPEEFQWKNYVMVWTDPEVSMLNAFGTFSSMAIFISAFRGQGIDISIPPAHSAFSTSMLCVPSLIEISISCSLIFVTSISCTESFADISTF